MDTNGITDFRAAAEWFYPGKGSRIGEIIEWAEVLRQITGHGALIVTDELHVISSLLEKAVEAKWAAYDEDARRGSWRNLWTPAGNPREVVKRALAPLWEVENHLTAAQAATVKVPKALTRHLAPIGREPVRRPTDFVLDDPDVW